MRRHRAEPNLNSFSNPDVTPLVDLTFLLLIVFMITAPALEYSLDINPPDLNAQAIDSSEHILINLDYEGKIYIDDSLVSLDMLLNTLSENAAKNSYIQIFLRADKSRPYGEVMDIMKLIRNIGITDVALVTKAEEK